MEIARWQRLNPIFIRFMGYVEDNGRIKIFPRPLSREEEVKIIIPKLLKFTELLEKKENVK